MPVTFDESLLPSPRGRAARQKPRIWFGYLPIWAECVPVDAASGRIDWPGVIINIGSGLIMGVREALGGIISASLVFTSADMGQITAMLPWGISMTLYTMSTAVLWYAVFGRLQYGYSTQQDLICILQSSLASQVANRLQDDPSRIPATVIAVICSSSVLCGISSFIMGKLGLGNYMLLFPTPVINGFLGAIGVVVVRAAMQTSSGVKFQYFYPEDIEVFCKLNRLMQVAAMVSMVFCMRLGPGLLKRCFPKSHQVERLGGLACQLIPVLVFYMICYCLGISRETLQERGWTYPNQGPSGPDCLWNSYSVRDVDIPTVIAMIPEMPPLILMSAMCTMMGVLAITDAFPTGPDGDPAPLDNIDFDMELCVVGTSSVLIGCTGGNLNFHKFSVIQLRLDGGSHRVAVLMIAFVSGALFWSGLPIGEIIPRWFLAGLFMNTGIHFLKGTILSYRSMSSFSWKGFNLPSPQYSIAPCTILMAVFFSPSSAILSGLLLSICIFLVNSAASSPVSNVVIGDRVVSRLKRPVWEMRTLRREGDRILLLYLQGQLFFGSARKLAAALAAAAANERVRFCILSFSRVTGVDASAARHLKTAGDRLRQRGCEVIYCRMNKAVFSALTAAKVVVAPDEDLLSHLQNLRWKTVPISASKRKRIPSNRERGRETPPPIGNKPWDEQEKTPSPNETPSGKKKLFVAPFSPSMSPRHSFRAEPAGPPPALAMEQAKLVMEQAASFDMLISDGAQDEQLDVKLAMRPRAFSSPLTSPLLQLQKSASMSFRPDAFMHETDALDYCDDQMLSEFCYAGEHVNDLEPYMLAYRVATTTIGTRVPEWAFEDMNNLPRGIMNRLKSFCDVHADVPKWTKMSEDMSAEGALCFVLRGSVSVIQMLPISEDVSLIEPEVHGFSFREGKRLIKRYPPGHVVGKNGFFLKHSGQVIDEELHPKLIVSSKMGPPAEIWVLQPEQWEEMPMDLKGPLTEMLCVQFADDEQHGRLQER